MAKGWPRVKVIKAVPEYKLKAGDWVIVVGASESSGRKVEFYQDGRKRTGWLAVWELEKHEVPKD